MNIGKLDKTITVQTALQTENAFGELVNAYVDLYTGIYANIEFTDSSEGKTDDNRVGETSAVFTIRKSAISKTFGLQHRIKYDSKVYDIEKVIPDEAGRFISLTAKYRGGK